MQSRYTFPSQTIMPVLEYVGVGRRFVAVFIDSFVIGIIVLIVRWVTGPDFLSGAAMTAVGEVVSRLTDISLGTVLQIFALLLYYMYYVIMEAMMGATVGKLALGICVVKMDGSPIGWREAIIRNLLCFIDRIPYGIPYLLGAILVWTSPTRQRFGDRVAHTVVVRRQSVPAYFRS